MGYSKIEQKANYQAWLDAHPTVQEIAKANPNDVISETTWSCPIHETFTRFITVFDLQNRMKNSNRLNESLTEAWENFYNTGKTIYFEREHPCQSSK